MAIFENVSFCEFADWAVQNENKWGLLREISCNHPTFGRAVVIRVGMRHGSANLTIRTPDNRDILLTADTDLSKLVFDRGGLIPIFRQAGYSMSDRKTQAPSKEGKETTEVSSDSWRKTEISRRNIRHLCHFTPLPNVPSILKHGLLPRSSLDKITPAPLLNDDERRDRQLSASCLSISFPNYKMFFHCRKRHKDRQWAVLLIATDVLGTNDCGFYYSNAASRAFSRSRPELYQTREAFLKLFAPSVGTGMRSAKIPSSYTTDPQAEVLVFGGIDPGTIISIQVRTSLAAEELAKLKVRNLIEVGDDYFKARSDCKDWPSDAVSNGTDSRGPDGKGSHDRDSWASEEVPF